MAAAANIGDRNRRRWNAVLDADLARANIGNTEGLGQPNHRLGPDERIQFFSCHLPHFPISVEGNLALHAARA